MEGSVERTAVVIVVYVCRIVVGSRVSITAVCGIIAMVSAIVRSYEPEPE